MLQFDRRLHRRHLPWQRVTRRPMCLTRGRCRAWPSRSSCCAPTRGGSSALHSQLSPRRRVLPQKNRCLIMGGPVVSSSSASSSTIGNGLPHLYVWVGQRISLMSSGRLSSSSNRVDVTLACRPPDRGTCDGSRLILLARLIAHGRNRTSTWSGYGKRAEAI